MTDITVTLDPVGPITATIAEGDIVVVLPTGATGPTGPAGPEGGSSVTYAAGENLSTGRVVIIDGGAAWYFQPDDLTHAGRAFGVTITSATTGNDVDIQMSGEIEDAALSFDPDKTLWVGADGEIFDTVQAGAGEVHQKAGISIEGDKMRIDFSIQIIKT